MSEEENYSDNNFESEKIVEEEDNGPEKIVEEEEVVDEEENNEEIEEVEETNGAPTSKDEIAKGIVASEVSEEMKKAYLDYAMSVIVSRALPSIEDGLKPVQRRILYSMNAMGLKPNTQTKKSARIVGDVIGKYHPHGDSAVYETMVRMAQDFSLRYPLVYGQGNFGSIDGDSAAAMRYTEAKLKPISSELLVDLEKGTVPFVDNYDSSLKEPSLLPGKLPALLLNGATGIAVGMSTNIPPHNLREICDAIISVVENPEVSLKELLEIVQGPDFPTGGAVTGEMEEIYSSGKGRLVMRGKTSIEKLGKKEAVVISEIPYMVNKSSLVEQIAILVRDKKIKDISDLRDESSKGQIRIVLELKKGAKADFIINALYKYTRLQDSFSMNLLALVGGQPKILGLKDVLEEYIKYRKIVITRRTEYDLKKAKERQEIVEGLLIALQDIDAVISLIKKSKNKTEAEEGLIKKYKLTKRQAEAILDTKLQQLTSLEVGKLKKEKEELEKLVKTLEKILGDIKEVLKIIKKEVKEIREKYGDPRRTNVLKRIKSISERDLVQKKDVIVTVTDKGYAKRMDVGTYKQQNRGGRGVIGSNLSTGDFTKQLISCCTHDYLMFFTSRGRVLWLKAYDIPEAERYSKGKALINLLGLKEEGVTNVISVNSFEDYLFMATRNGQVKKIALSHFSKPRSSGIKAINLPNDDSDALIGVEILKKGQEVMLATRKGQAIRFNADDVRLMGRASYGVTGIKLNKEDFVVSMEVLGAANILTVTEKGYGKRTAVEDYRKTARAGKGVINLKVSEKTGNVVNTVAVMDKDSILITTAKGMIIRTGLDKIRVMGRAAQGVRIVKLQVDDRVSDVVRVVENGED
jgi:DNA gyrase subunit A